jgi:AAA+ superfamily predicted ATPase
MTVIERRENFLIVLDRVPKTMVEYFALWGIMGSDFSYTPVYFSQPPGTGKTKLIQSIAAKTSLTKIHITTLNSSPEIHFLTTSGGDLLSCYYGGSEQLIRNLFEEAKKKTPALIFFGKILPTSVFQSNQRKFR